MALSSRELYLVLRAKNEATAALNAMGRDLDKARASAELMGLQAQKAHLQAEQAAQRSAKAQAEYAQRMLESQRATAQQGVAMENARQKTLQYNQSVLEGQQAAQRHQLATLQQKNAIDQNAVSLLQNAKAQNQLQIEQLRSVQGSGEQIAGLRNANQALQQQIITTREGIVARNDEINAVRRGINTSQEEINAGNQRIATQRNLVAGAQTQVHSYDEQIQRQRDSVSEMRSEIASRQTMIQSVDREIASTRQANAERALASQKLRDTGQAAMVAGTTLATGGAIGIAAIVHLTGVAADYEHQTAKTLTQTQGLGANLKQLGDIGLDTAKNFGVPFDQIQASLYDIFSSMDVNVPQAKTLLNDFAKAAVGGVTDVKTAGDATIAIMNAYHIPVSQATRVLDEQFQTVKLGRVEYDQLAGSIGRAIPSAQRAGQQFNVLGGMIALMTRNGATASQAVTSAGRAMDLFANSTVGDRLAKIGVQTRDAAGNFLPLTGVIEKLRQKLSDLSPQARAKELDALFKGSGNNIQARRFVDLVTSSDQAAKAFVSLSDQVKNSSGAMDTAYGTMAGTVSNKNQLLKNNFHVLEIELGNALLPVLTQIVHGLTNMVTWFENLSPGQQKFLAWGLAIGSALAVVVGVLVTIVGGLMVLAAAVGIGVVALGGMIAAVVAFAAIWIVAYEKIGWFHDAVNAYWKGIWEGVKWLGGALKDVWDAIVDMLKGAWSDLQAIWSAMKNGFQDTVDFFKSAWNGMLGAINSAWAGIQVVYHAIINAGKDVGDAAVWLWHSAIEPVWNGIVGTINIAWAGIQVVWNGIKTALGVLGQAFMLFYTTDIQPVWTLIKLAIDIAWAGIQVTWGLIQIGIKILGGVFVALGNDIHNIWNAIEQYSAAFWSWLQANVFTPIMNFIHGPLATAWNWLMDLIHSIWDHIQQYSAAFWNWLQANVFTPIMNFIHGPLASAWNWFMDLIHSIWDHIQQYSAAFWSWLQGNVFNPIMNFIHGPLASAWDYLVTHVNAAWDTIKNYLNAGWNWIRDNVFNRISDAVTKTIPDAFNTCVRAVESAWDRVKAVVAAPIHWVLESALNNGILRGYNALASSFHVSPNNVQVAVPFASGGPVWGPGGPRSDIIPALLSNGEHVLTAAEVKKLGGQQAVIALRQRLMSGDPYRVAMAAGGPVVAGANRLAGVGNDVTMVRGPQGGPLDWLGNIASAILDPLGSLRKLADIFGSIPDAGNMSGMLVGAGKHILDGIIDWVKDKFIPAAPAGAGDLSGPQGNSVARILQWARVFYPGAVVSSGYRPGANDYHGMGLAADLIGGGYSGMNTIAAGFYGMSGRLLEEIHNDGGAGYAVKNGARVDGASFYRSVWAEHANHVHIAATNAALADSGGILRPGMNLITNNTGGTERILSMAQTQSFDRLVALLGQGPGVGDGLTPVGGFGRGGSRPVTVIVNTNEIDPRRHAMMLGTELQNQIG